MARAVARPGLNCWTKAGLVILGWLEFHVAPSWSLPQQMKPPGFHPAPYLTRTLYFRFSSSVPGPYVGHRANLPWVPNDM